MTSQDGPRSAASTSTVKTTDGTRRVRHEPLPGFRSGVRPRGQECSSDVVLGRRRRQGGAIARTPPRPENKCQILTRAWS